MRIELNHGPEHTAQTRVNARNSAATAAAAAGSGLGEDQAQISGARAQVDALAAQASQLPEIRQERVEALRHAVQGGHYRPSAKNVAEAMFTHLSGKPAA